MTKNGLQNILSTVKSMFDKTNDAVLDIVNSGKNLLNVNIEVVGLGKYIPSINLTETLGEDGWLSLTTGGKTVESDTVLFHNTNTGSGDESTKWSDNYLDGPGEYVLKVFYADDDAAPITLQLCCTDTNPAYPFAPIMILAETQTETTVSVSKDYKYAWFRIVVPKGVAYGSGNKQQKVRFMVCKKSAYLMDPTWQRHTPTNKTLNANIATLNKNIKDTNSELSKIVSDAEVDQLLQEIFDS